MAAENQDGPLTIVVFRDLHLEETMNLQILSLISIMFSLYAGAITIALVATNWILEATRPESGCGPIRANPEVMPPWRWQTLLQPC